MPRRLNAFCSSLPASSSSCGIRCGSISMIVTSLPKRSKIDANSQPMMPPPRTTSRRGTSVCARSPVESTQRGESRPGIGGVIGYEPVATIALLKVTSSPPSTAIEVVLVKRPAPAHPLDAVRLEQRGDAACHLLHDGRLPLPGLGEVEPRLRDAHAELRERLARVVEGVRGLHPGLRGNAAHAQAGAAELGLALDAGDLAAELRGADRRRVARRASSEDGDVNFHAIAFRRVQGRCYSERESVSVARSVNESSLSPTCSKPCCW